MNAQGQYSGMMENYKGIMLCSRPQDQINLDQNKPFMSRVHHDEPCGYNPVQKFTMYKAQKRTKPVLRKHKLWLEEYSMKMSKKFNPQEINEVTRPKIQSHKIKEKNNETIDKQQTEFQDEQVKESNNNSKKKPQWALSESQLMEQEEQELEALIDFAKGLDYDSYINDLEVKVMLEALKVRVEEIKGNEVERIKILSQPKQYDTESQQNRNLIVKPEHQKNVKKTTFADDEREDWDKSTTMHEQKITVEERLAKYIAEEILKKNKHLRGLHSKLSLRRVLEMEAQSQLQVPQNT